MGKKVTLTKTVLARIEKTVAHYESQRSVFDLIAKALHYDLTEDATLRPLIHFAKYRIKDPEHLRHKLRRKALEAKQGGRAFTISPENLFDEIQDLAGVRLLHLHTTQMETIHSAILSVLNECRYEIIEGPIANLWDDEARAYFDKLGIETKTRADSMYTSVHYIVRPNRRTKVACELQVRTLSEELWGEVSHKINYPDETDSVACREQLKVLARVASSATRLVDAIFKSHSDHQKTRDC